jgi:hypothetical protein
VGLRHKETQSNRAKRPRGRITEDGKTINQIIADLVLRAEHRDETAKELWPHFSAELERYELNPTERPHPTDHKKCAYAYTVDGRPKRISYGQFANVVSRIRKSKKSA